VLRKHNVKARFETKDSNSLITSLCIEFIGEIITLNQKDPMILFINLLPQLITFNIPEMIEFHFLNLGVQVFLSRA